MADINAIAILSKQIETFKTASELPRTIDDVENYRARIKKMLDEGRTEVTRVQTYILQVGKKLRELIDTQSAIIRKNQDALQTLFAGFQFNTIFSGNGGKETAVDKLLVAQEIERASQAIMNDRLNELVKETEMLCAKLEDDAGLLKEDIENLKRCLKDWKNAKADEKKRQKLEERRQKQAQKEMERRENEEKKKQEEEVRKKRQMEEAERKTEDERRKRKEQQRQRDAEQQRKQDDMERRRKEIEDREKKEEEEKRRQKEQEDIDRKAEEERIRKEAEEQSRKEEEHNHRMKQEKLKRERDEADRKSREEKARLEKEQLRKEAERLKLEQKVREESERKRLEEEENQRKEADKMAWRRNTNNWENLVYDRPCDEVDGRRVYHGGITCIVSTPPGEIKRDDISCSGHDEVDSIIEILQPNEKPASSIINLTSLKKTPVQTQIPARVYIPQISESNKKYETVLKVSIDGSDWVEFLPLEPISNLIENVRNVEKINGFEISSFTNIKALVVNRPRSETIIVDKPSVSIRSSMDKNIKMFVPGEAFLNRTVLQLSVQNFSEEHIDVFVKENADFHYIHGVTTLIALTCQTPPRKSIEINVVKPHRKQGNDTQKQFKTYQLNKMSGECWQFADIECKQHDEDTTVVLKNGKYTYIVMLLEMPSNFPTENVVNLAEILHTCVYKTIVRMIVKQNIESPQHCIIRIVGREECQETLKFLSDSGYTKGPEVSAEFSVTEGQHLQICLEGNIEIDDKSNQKIEMTYLSYMGGARTQMTLRTKDIEKQKDLPAYVGAVKCTVLSNTSGVTTYTKTVTLNVALPKQGKGRTVISHTKVQFPYYLTALVNFVTQDLFNKNQNAWKKVLTTLMDKAAFQSGHRKAKRKNAENDEIMLCKTMLLDWMKTQAVHVDKLNAIVEALKHNGHWDIAEACVEYVKFQKEHLSDDVLADLADKKSKNVQTLGEELGLDKAVVDNCIRANASDTKGQLTSIMMEWRGTDDAILYGERALNHLHQLCV